MIPPARELVIQGGDQGLPETGSKLFGRLIGRVFTPRELFFIPKEGLELGFRTIKEGAIEPAPGPGGDLGVRMEEGAGQKGDQTAFGLVVRVVGSQNDCARAGFFKEAFEFQAAPPTRDGFGRLARGEGVPAECEHQRGREPKLLAESGDKVRLATGGFGPPPPVVKMDDLKLGGRANAAAITRKQGEQSHRV